MNKSRPTCACTFGRRSINCGRIWRSVCGALLDRAEQAGNAAMPAYTHLQRAEPVLVAHWLLAYVEMFLRDADGWPIAASG